MVHYFGDSFTEGCGIVKQTKSISASKIDLISPDISKNLLENSLTKLLKEQHYKNYAVGGVCNEDIVNSIYSNINQKECKVGKYKISKKNGAQDRKTHSH